MILFNCDSTEIITVYNCLHKASNLEMVDLEKLTTDTTEAITVDNCLHKHNTLENVELEKLTVSNTVGDTEAGEADN